MNKAESFKTIETHSTNPFLDDVFELSTVEPRKKNVKELTPFTNLETGDTISIPRNSGDIIYYWEDASQFIKVYSTGNNFKAIADFSKSASYVFWLISSKLKPKQEIVTLTLAEYLDFSKTTSRASFYAGILELSNLDFIAKIGSDSYYINPTKFFNGSRTSLMDRHSNAEQAYYDKYGKKIPRE